MEISFDSRVVLVTGSSRGLGSAVARLFAEAGAEVVVHFNRSKKEAEELARGLPGTGHITAGADLSDPSEVENLVSEVLRKKGRIDILVNNAGIYDEDPDWIRMDYGDWQKYWYRTIDANLTGPANLSFLAAKSMAGKGGGKIVNITSRGAFRGEPDALPYGTAKAGLNSLGQSMAKKLASHNIYVFTLAPGFIRTDMTTHILESERGEAIAAQSPLNRVATPEEIARAVLFLASDGNEYMTGSVVDMNGASYLR